MSASGALAFEAKYGADLIGGFELANLKSDSKVDPSNEVFQLYEKAALLDLRPYLEVTHKEFTKLTLRPRYEGYYGTSPRGGHTETEYKRDLWLNEGFLSLYPKDDLQLHVGRQSFLWGPSEVVGPSNPFYSDVLNRPNPLFQLRGITMARANYSIGNEYTLVAMAELKALDDADFEVRFPEEEENRHRLLVKGEYASSDGALSLGVTGGQNKLQTELLEDSYTHFLGGYLMWTLSPAAQVYGDLRVDFDEEESWPYYVAGLRWTFEDGTEWRNEYIRKELGLDDSERKALDLSLASPFVSGTLAQALKGNQDNLLSEEYYYSSLRLNLDSVKALENAVLGLRSLYSLTSESGILSTFLEGGVNDSTTLVGYLAQSYGKDQGDFNSLVNTIGGVFLKVSL